MIVHNLQPVADIIYPLGLTTNDKDYFVNRIISYIPLTSFLGGGYTIYLSVQQIYNKVIRNQNETVFNQKEPDDGRVFLHHTSVELNRNERLKLLGLSLALFIRGVVECCQLGVVFLPFDLLCDHIKKTNEKQP